MHVSVCNSWLMHRSKVNGIGCLPRSQVLPLRGQFLTYDQVVQKSYVKIVCRERETLELVASMCVTR